MKPQTLVWDYAGKHQPKVVERRQVQLQNAAFKSPAVAPRLRVLTASLPQVETWGFSMPSLRDS